jgi:hypothetical protein
MPARSTEEARPMSLRIPNAIYDWVKAESDRRGGIAFATVINEALEIVRTVFNLPVQTVALLDRAGASLSLTRTQHIAYILTEYANKILIEEARSGTTPPARTSGPVPAVSGARSSGITPALAGAHKKK